MSPQVSGGVASGDPTEDGVIIWTRATPEADGLVRITWEVAEDDSFDAVVASGSGTTSADVDYTVKVDVSGLDAGATYHYRFRVGDTSSPTGRTRLPGAGATDNVRFAVISCSNYPAGFFNVYREIAGAELDAVLHLGDYIYEYDKDGYASERAEEFGRVSEPENELYSLEDYRTRYAQYRGDPDLQAAHGAHPFINVWDDHEIANDAWKDGAQNHDPETEGSFDDRVAAALQAFYEWTPIRPPSTNREIIYRQFRYGDLVDLLMLDTRLIGRDLQVNYTDFYNGESIDVDTARAAVNDSNQELLGGDQTDWLKDRLTNSTARWQVLGQQVLVGRYLLPEPVTRAFAGLATPEEGISALLASESAKATPEPLRTPEQQALLDSALPYNPDAWDGYGFNRDEIIDHAAALGSRLVTLAGDTHNAWATQLTDSSGNPAGVEFATASVTSPGFDQLGVETAALLETPLVFLIDDLKYANLTDRGYMVVTFEQDTATSDWIFVSSIESTTYELLEERANTIRVSADDLTI